MSADTATIFVILGLTMLMFAWGKFRHDFIAIAALLTTVLLGLVSPEQAFLGFGHPAVITVAAVLIISKALKNSGLVNLISNAMAATRSSTTRQVAAGSGVVALISCFMNNVGALAIMMPVVLRNASKAKRSPSSVLMPLSFASLLGGLITLIGTPTNLVISGYRKEFTGQPYGMFDFAPVGLSVAVVGILYLSLVGWRLLPQRVSAVRDSGRFHVEEYVSEVLIPENSSLIGQQVRKLEREFENELTVMTIVRKGERRQAPRGIEKFKQSDTLIIEGDPSILEPLFGDGRLKQAESLNKAELNLNSSDVGVVEVVLMPNSPIEGYSMRGLRMHDRYNINLLAIARSGERTKTRLANTRFKVGDVLCLQGEKDALEQAYTNLGLLELAERGLQNPVRRNFILPMAFFALAIFLVAIGMVPATIAFVSVVMMMIAFKVISAREVYSSIEWPIIVLLGALIPVGGALQTSGGTDWIAAMFIDLTGDAPPWMVIALLLIASMWLSDIIPNTPVAVVMAPLGYSISQQLGLATDPFLMAVAIGCATPFLTPIGHQSNTLVMGPGGYRFLDYARMGFTMEVLVIITAVPMIMIVWPV